jgi:3-oxoadipate CoA-transferase alpha subunit
MDKVVTRPGEVLRDVPDDAVVLVGGWGGVGIPTVLIDAFAQAHPARANMTVVSNNCGTGTPNDVGRLFAADLVKKVITSFPTHPGATYFRTQVESGRVEVELVPQGTLVERLRSGGVGLGGFYTPTAAGTELAAGKRVAVLDGRPQVFEAALKGDVALVHAWKGDRFGNLRYRGAGRAFNSVMAMNAGTVIAQVEEFVDGAMDPDDIHTSGIFVDHVLVVGAAA